MTQNIEFLILRTKKHICRTHQKMLIQKKETLSRCLCLCCMGKTEQKEQVVLTLRALNYD